MTVFANKEEFVRLGTEQIRLSDAHVSQDCTICKAPLAIQPSDTIKSAISFHAPVRVFACGHIIGQECLDAWLDSGNSCPKCNRMLFENTGNQITQQDVDRIVLDLGVEFGEHRVMAAVARLMDRQDVERARLQVSNMLGMTKLKAQEAQTKREEFMMTDEDFFDSEDDMDFGGDYDDGDEDFMFEEQDALDIAE